MRRNSTGLHERLVNYLTDLDKDNEQKYYVQYGKEITSDFDISLEELKVDIQAWGYVEEIRVFSDLEADIYNFAILARYDDDYGLIVLQYLV